MATQHVGWWLHQPVTKKLGVQLARPHVHMQRLHSATQSGHDCTHDCTALFNLGCLSSLWLLSDSLLPSLPQTLVLDGSIKIWWRLHLLLVEQGSVATWWACCVSVFILWQEAGVFGVTLSVAYDHAATPLPRAC